MQTLWQDVRYSARMLLKKPTFTLIAVLTLALGIGANSAIFSVVNGVLLRPLPYHQPEQIVTLLQEGQGPVSPANFFDLKAGGQRFSQMAAAEAWGGTLAGSDSPQVVGGLRMGEGLFDLLGVSPLFGRALQTDDYRPGRDHVLVLSHGLWKRAFGADRRIVGRQLTLNGDSYTVVGVMPPQFQFPPFWSTRAEMWAPLDLTSRASNRGGSSLRVFARLKPGATLEHAQSEAKALSAKLALAYPEANTGLDVRVDSLNEKVVGDVRPALLVLSVTVCFVLLIACANVACLLLARGSSRQRETTVRVALGASRWRILRLLLAESMLLSFLGAVVGIFLAVWGVHWLTGMLGGSSNSFNVRLPRMNEIKLDTATLAFTFVVSILTALLFGLAPALSFSKPDLNQVLKEGGRGTTGGRRRLRETLVVAELALALVLLVGAGLLMSSFSKLQSVDPGFVPDNVLSMTISTSGLPQYVGPARETLYQQLTERLTSLPGVQSVGAINHLPLAGDVWGTRFHIEGRPLPPPGEGPVAVDRVSRPGYFQTMRIPFLAGRDFSEDDTGGTPGVVIINETLARRHWPSEDPIGKRLTFDNPGTSEVLHWQSVVGVVRDVKQTEWVNAPRQEIYTPFQQSRNFLSGTAPHLTSMTLVLRTGVAAESLAEAVQATVKAVDRNLPVSRVATMEQVIADTLWQPRFNLQLIGLFAGLALILAVVGLYGVMSYSAAGRTQEVGLRMALGAGRGDVVRMMIVQGMKLALLGVATGLLAAFALTHLMAGLLFQVSATDLTTFLSIAAILTVVALLACWIPARRAAKVDPMTSLRYE